MASPDPYLSGKPCPKCGYVRTAADTNPAWQCPSCHIAYHKYGAASAKLVARVAAGGRELAAEGASDRSAFTLIAANLFAAVVAVVFGMDLKDLMLVYWVQSVIIGFSFFIRMLNLQQYSTEGFSGVGEGKITNALFFLFHYGGFHAGYLLFLVAGPESKGTVMVPVTGLGLCALAFAVNHAYSLAHNIRLDRSGSPNLGTMMFLPYARVVPMHLTIIFGDQLAGGMQALMLFIGLKTAADVIMHVIEHHVLRKGRALPFVTPFSGQ